METDLWAWLRGGFWIGLIEVERQALNVGGATPWDEFLDRIERKKPRHRGTHP